MKKHIGSLVLILGIMTASFVHAQQPPVATDSKFPLFKTIAAAEHRCPFDVIVWLNTKEDTYSLSSPSPEMQMKREPTCASVKPTRWIITMWSCQQHLSNRLG